MSTQSPFPHGESRLLRSDRPPAGSPPRVWVEYWRSQFRRLLGPEEIRTGLAEAEPFLEKFLAAHFCHPCQIAPASLKAFFDGMKASLAPSILPGFRFFYERVAPSSPHVQVLAGENHLTAMSRELKLRNFTAATQTNYLSSVRDFLSRSPHLPGPSDAQRVRKYLVDLRETRGLAPRTINLAASALSFFYRQVLNAPAVVENLPRMKEGKPLPKLHSLEEIRALLEVTVHPVHRLVLSLAYGCGLRLGEIRALRVEDLDLEGKLLWVRHAKGNKDRVVMLDASLVPALRVQIRHRSRNGSLFSGRNGAPLSPRTVEKIYENACQKAGIKRPGGIHTLRHSFATHLLEQGIDVKHIQALLGHAHSKTTELYLHLSTRSIKHIRSPLAGVMASLVRG